MGKLLVVTAIAVTIAIFFAGLYAFGFFNAPGAPLDTKTHGYTHSGFYGTGAYTGEVLQSDKILTNVTGAGNGSMSQDVVMQAEVCQQQSSLGTVFIDGAKVTEPDAIYKVYVNGALVQTYAIEIGDSTATLRQCLAMPLRDYIMTGSVNGFVRVELWVYVFDFQQGAGQYQTLVSDQAALTTASS